MNKTVFCLIAFIILCGCKNKEAVQPETVRNIDLVKAFETGAALKISQIAENIEYVRLSSEKENLLKSYLRIYTNEKYIIAISFRQIFLFDKASGKFIREIGEYGKGPEGYRNTEWVMPYDQERDKIYAAGWNSNSHIEYLTSGKITQRIQAPPNSSSICMFDDTTSVAYIRNYDGSAPQKLVSFSKSNPGINFFPNYSRFEKTRSVVSRPRQGWFYKYNRQTSFFELFTDTVYRLSQNQLTPCYAFNMGKYSPPYDQQAVPEFHDKEPDYFFLSGINESENILLFYLNYRNNKHIVLYDKKTESTYVSNHSKESPELLENDIDNFLPIEYYTLNNNNELIGYLEAYKIVKWFADNPDKVAQLPLNLQQFKDIKESDNPVVMIAKLKE